MGFDVIVVIDGSDLGEKVLRYTWEIAQELFRKYELPVFVIPRYIRSSKVSIIVNGVEYVIRGDVSKEEIMDMILTALPIPKTSNLDVVVLGTWGNYRNDLVGDASLI